MPDIAFANEDVTAIAREMLDPTECTYATAIGTDAYVAEFREFLGDDLWEDGYDDLLADVIADQCGE